MAAALSVAGAAPALPPPAALIDALERAMPLTRAKVERVLPPLRCAAPGCAEYRSRFGGLWVDKVDLRGAPPFFVLVLSGIGGDCVPVAVLARRYGPTHVENGCSDGATCLSAYAARPWGSLFLRLPRDGDLRACAREIVLNSDRRGVPLPAR